MNGRPMFVGRHSSPIPGILLVLAIPVLFAVGIGIRLWVWPARGLAGDIDQFVLWVHGIAVNGWQNAYDQNLSFPAVMAWVWGALAWAEPAFRTVTDASDPAIGALMKVPASLADIAIAVAVGWWFRDRAWAAVAAMAAVLLWPVTWYVSAWWGQYESLYVLPAVLALLAARGGHALVAAALLTVAMMTNADAIPLVVPFAAWVIAVAGARGALRALVAGVAVGLVAWAPFVASGGPAAYIGNATGAAGGPGAEVSTGGWNPWWIIGSLGGDGTSVLASTAAVGPVTFAHVGFALMAVVVVAVFIGVARRPSGQGLALGMAAMALGGAVVRTGMAPTAAYAAFVFLLMAANGRVLAIVWAAFAIAYAANLVFAAPPPAISMPDERIVGLIGSGAITLAAVLTLLWMGSADRRDADDGGQPLHSLWPTMG